MMYFPVFLTRIAITLLILWLIWALLIGPFLFSSQTFLRQHYWWMLP